MVQPEDLLKTDCSLCLTDAHDREVYQANFDCRDLTPAVFTARRRPDRVHYRMVVCRQCGLMRANPVLKQEALGALYRQSKGQDPRLVTPIFSWKRPLRSSAGDGRIYQFVHYEDFWYDMSMTDAPSYLGYPQSASRWTFELSEHTSVPVLADYAQYKILTYDADHPKGSAFQGPSPDLSIDHFDVNTLKMKSDFSQPEILVYNDSYTSSWKAYVDGKPAELMRVNVAFKGMRVPAGQHLLEFSYHPPGGSWVCLAATAALAGFLLSTVFTLKRGP